MSHLPKTDIIFFDLPSILGVSTSPNCWKVRLALNHKKLDYKTQWVETSDIETTLKALSIPPTTKKPNGDPKWTLPALIDRTSSTPIYLADSTPIVEYLDRTYPPADPVRAGLFRGESRGLHAIFEAHLAASVQANLLPLMVLHMYSKKGPRDQVDFRGRLEKALGRPLEDIALRGEAREAAWARIEAAFAVFGRALAQNGGGEFVMGELPSFADFALCGQILSMKNASAEEAWTRISQWDEGRWVRYVAAFKEWIVVQ